MRTAITVVAAVLLAAVFVGTAAGHTYTFTGDAGGQWDNSGNWDSNSGTTYPASGDTAIIPHIDEEVACFIIPSRAEECDAIQIQEGGILHIRANDSIGGQLTISETSVVDGKLLFTYDGSPQPPCEPEGEVPAVLRIDESLTITGDGGFIMGGCNKFLRSPGLITGSAGAVLTLQNDSPGVLTAKGHMEIEVELVNNAVVCVGTDGDVTEDDQPNYVLSLTDRDKSGNGLWAAYTGTLQVDYGVSGNGAWKLLRAGDKAVIQINAVCYVGGLVTLLRGTFDVQEDFCSTGDGQMYAYPLDEVIINPPPTLFVNVANGKTLSLGGSCFGAP